MKDISIYDPAMCCSTGLCGPNINPELLRIATALQVLERQGIKIGRHNLSSEPMAYVTNKAVNDYMKAHGADCLPLTLVDGEIVLSATYPTNNQLEEWTGGDLSAMPSDERCKCSCQTC